MIEFERFVYAVVHFFIFVQLVTRPRAWRLAGRQLQPPAGDLPLPTQVAYFYFLFCSLLCLESHIRQCTLHKKSIILYFVFGRQLRPPCDDLLVPNPSNGGSASARTHRDQAPSFTLPPTSTIHALTNTMTNTNRS